MEISLEKQPEVKNTCYAGFWIRFAASLLDGIILAVPMTIIMIAVFFILFTSSGIFDLAADPEALEQEMTGQQAITLLLSFVIVFFLSVLLPVFYYAGMHTSKWQATIGKKLLKLKVSDLQGNRISLWRALGRYLAMAFLSGIFYIGYIIAAFTDKKQALHDLIAGTVVVKEED